MTAARVLVAGVLAVVTLAAPGAAGADGGVPDPRFSSCDPIVVGNVSGIPIGGLVQKGFDVSVRDVNNAPKPFSPVVLDFSTSTIRLSSVQVSGTTVDCAARTLTRLTDAAGNVKIAARIGGWVGANDVVVIIQDGWPPFGVKARSTDIDGIDGKTSLNDLALFSANFLANPAAQETDFDLNGNTGLGDYMILTVEFLGPGTNTYCP